MKQRTNKRYRPERPKLATMRIAVHFPTYISPSQWKFALLFYLFKAAILSNSKNFVVGRFVRHVEISPQSPQSSTGIDR